MQHKSRKQCVVMGKDGKWTKVKACHVGCVVYDNKTRLRLGVLVEPNPNTNMLRLRLEDKSIITLR